MPKAKTVLLLKTVAADMSAYGGFVWPESGEVTAEQWNPYPGCGDGLHGLLWGCGGAKYLSSRNDAKWLVFKALAKDVVEFGGNAKVPAAEVVFSGTRADAVDYLQRNGAAGMPVVYGTAIAGAYGTAIGGEYGVLQIFWHDGNRYHIVTGYVGEDGIEANKPYVVRNGKICRA